MNLQQQLGEWYPLLSHVFDTDWMKLLGRRLGAAKNIAPSLGHVFRAFTLCPPSRVKVVVMLQDPYINGEADGLAMSSYGKITPSLEVVFEEINRTHQCQRTQTHLDDWARQGVLLINACLTTRLGKSRAHQNWGWELFIGEVLAVLNHLNQPIVYLMWGKDAQTVIRHMPTRQDGGTSAPQLILKAHHPQAQNYNPDNKFVGCNHFVESNEFLVRYGVSPIWWCDLKWLLENKDRYSELVCKLVHSNQSKPYAQANISQSLYNYPAISNEPHPFERDRLQSGYSETLPF